MRGVKLPKFRRREDPNWLGEQITVRDFADVPHPDAPLSKRKRRLRLYLGCVLLALPFSAISLLQSCGARTTAVSAARLSESTSAALAEREQAEEPQLIPEAISMLQARLGAGRHHLAAATLVPAGFQVVDLGEEHTVGIIQDGEYTFNAHAVVNAAGTVGVTFAPVAYQTLPGERIERPEECWEPTPPPGQRSPDGSWLELLAAGAGSQLTLGDYWPDQRLAPEIVEMDKLERWLAAWVTGEQTLLRELGSHLDDNPQPWFGVDGHTYAAGSANVRSVVQLKVATEQELLIAHVQFASCSLESTGLLVQDLEIEMRQDGQLLRILAGSPMGEPAI